MGHDVSWRRQKYTVHRSPSENVKLTQAFVSHFSDDM